MPHLDERVLRVLGLPPTATAEAIARRVAHLAGFPPPTEPVTFRVLEGAVRSLSVRLDEPGPLDSAEVAMPLDLAFAGITPEERQALARDLDVKYPGSAIGEWIAVSVAPRLALAGLINLIPPPPPDLRRWTIQEL